MQDSRRILRWLARMLFLAALVAGGRAEAKPAVTAAKLGVQPDLTRVELTLSAAADYRVFTLSDPDRVVIDFSELAWKVSDGRKLQGRGLVAGLRYGLYKAGTSRVVLDLTAPAVVADARILPATGNQPVRFAIDLRPGDEASYRASSQSVLFASDGAAKSDPPTPPKQDAAKQDRSKADGAAAAAAAGKPLAASKLASMQPSTAKPADKGGPPTLVAAPPAKVVAAVAAPPPKPLIVIDPGHGGIDPGALGSHTMEKNITLAMAKQLKQALLDTGRFRVVLTRDKDVFIPLRDRYKIARDKGADLFISLHADSETSNLARGASVYTLSDKASDAEAEALAAKENKSDVIAGVDLSEENQTVTGILIDLAQRETTNLSQRFASLLVNDLKSDTTMLENSHRAAGFAVLKAPDVPSALLEMGYISNPNDERLLTDPKHQKALCEGITHAIEDYFDWRDMIRRT